MQQNMPGHISEMLWTTVLFISLMATIFADSATKDESCKENRTFDKYSSTWLHWPTTQKNNIAIPVQLCLTANGSILTRRCKQERHSSSRWGEVTEQCEGTPEEVTILLYQLSMVRATANNVEGMSSQLCELTKYCDQLQEASLEYVTKTLEHIALGCKTTDKVIPTIFRISDNILTCINESKLISSEKLLKTSSRIVKHLTEITQRSQSDFDLSTVMLAARKITSIKVSGEMMKIGLQKASTTVSKQSLELATNENPKSFGVFNYKTTVALSRNVATSITVVVYKKSALFMPYNISKRNANWKMKYSDITLSVTCSDDFQTSTLDATVTFSFDIADVTYPRYAKCLNKNGNIWSTECTTTLHNDNIFCQCHNFYNNTMTITLVEECEDNVYDMMTPQKLIWNYITYTGSALSLFCLSIIIFTFLMSRKWKQGTQHHVLFHLSVALCGDVLTLLLSYKLTYSETGCVIIAALQHFFTLSIACWMITGSLVQYLRVVKEYGDHIAGFLLKAITLAWGLPILVVLGAALINHKLYNTLQTHGMCWMKHNFSIYAFATPLIAIFTLNTIFLSLILNTLCCNPKTYWKTSRKDWTIAKRRCLAALLTMAILGFKWAFYYLAMEGHYKMKSTISEIMILYLHYIFFPSQGFFIFVLQFLWDPTVKMGEICRRRLASA